MNLIDVYCQLARSLLLIAKHTVNKTAFECICYIVHRRQQNHKYKEKQAQAEGTCINFDFESGRAFIYKYYYHNSLTTPSHRDSLDRRQEQMLRVNYYGCEQCRFVCEAASNRLAEQ